MAWDINRALRVAIEGAMSGLRAGALLAKRIVKMELIAYPDLGPEAVYRLFKDFPVFVSLPAW